jgi:hypothetical protein
MKCNQEQFKAIEPKLNGLKISGIEDFETFDYLVNNYDGNRRIVISNVLNSEAVKNNTHETWNEQIFLNACGIETDTYTVSKEFILNLHENVIWTSLRTEIENEFPELFPKPKTKLTISEIEAKLGYEIEIVK